MMEKMKQACRKQTLHLMTSTAFLMAMMLGGGKDGLTG
jgi:hypothetical protein